MKVTIDNIEYEQFNPFQRCMKRFIFNPLINHVLPPSFLKSVLSKSKSELAHESLKAPGNWKCMQISYDNKPPRDLIDRFVLVMGSFPAGLRNRKKMSVAMINDLLQRYKAKPNIILVGIGSARADNALEAIRVSGLKNKVKAFFFDLDDAAMEPGRQLAREMKLDQHVQYIQADANLIKNHLPDNADLLKLIGIIEYLTDEQILELLKVGYKNLHPGGTVITHSIEPHHGITPFLKKVFGLDLMYRTPDHVKKLLNDAGFEILDEKREPLGIYTMISGIKKK